jgi:hypothetical protein
VIYLQEPFEETLSEVVKGSFPSHVMGQSVSSWSNLTVAQKRLNEQMRELQINAQEMEDEYKARQMRRQEEIAKKTADSSFVMGLVIALFTPLSFLTGVYGMNFQVHTSHHVYTTDRDPLLLS